MGGASFRAQTRVQTEGAEMKDSEEQKWGVNPTNITTQPPISPVRWQGS